MPAEQAMTRRGSRPARSGWKPVASTTAPPTCPGSTVKGSPSTAVTGLFRLVRPASVMPPFIGFLPFHDVEDRYRRQEVRHRQPACRPAGLVSSPEHGNPEYRERGR